MSTWFHSFFTLLFPHYCLVCHHALSYGEEYICIGCNMHMPRTHYHLSPGNPAEKLFWGRIPIDRVAALFHYRNGSDFCRIIHELKYKGKKKVGKAIGKQLAYEIADSGFFDDIDIICPLPLHKIRKRNRGYNQSEWIARGIAAVRQIPIDTETLIRTVHTPTQTHQSVFDRWENVKDAFGVVHPERLAGKHILLVDDVLTTGATLIACASTLAKVEGVRFSVITLAVAGQ